MLERILIPLDGSERAEAILTQVRPLLKRSDADVILLRAVTDFVPADPTSAGILAPPDSREAADRYVSSWAAILSREGVRARGIARSGPAAEVILDVAAQEHATLIAMTTHGRTGLSRWVLGSVAEKVVRAADAPTLVVRSFQRAESATAPPVPRREVAFGRILVPVGTGDLSLEVLPTVISFARLFSSRVYLVHVLEDAAAYAPAPPQMKRAADYLREAGVAHEPILGRGDAAGQIVDLAEQHAVDLIAMSTHGRSGPSRWAFGSVTEKVLRAASVPMLVVRGRAKTTLAF